MKKILSAKISTLFFLSLLISPKLFAIGWEWFEDVKKDCGPYKAGNVIYHKSAFNESFAFGASVVAKASLVGKKKNILKIDTASKIVKCSARHGHWDIYLPSEKDALQLSRWRGVRRVALAHKYNCEGKVTFEIALEQILSDSELEDLRKGERVNFKVQLLHRASPYVFIDDIKGRVGDLARYSGVEIALSLEGATLTQRNLRLRLIDTPFTKNLF